MGGARRTYFSCYAQITYHASAPYCDAVKSPCAPCICPETGHEKPARLGAFFRSSDSWCGVFRRNPGNWTHSVGFAHSVRCRAVSCTVVPGPERGGPSRLFERAAMLRSDMESVRPRTSAGQNLPSALRPARVRTSLIRRRRLLVSSPTVSGQRAQDPPT